MKRFTVQRTFNLVCITVMGFFVLGTAWVWRGEIAMVMRQASHPAAVPVSEIVVPKINAIIVSEPIRHEDVGQIIEEHEPHEHGGEQQEVIADTGLPVQVNLAVPFTSQAPEGNWDQPWQDACEEAAILMLDAYYKQYDLSVLFSKNELQKMVDWETAKSWGGSISIERVQQATEHYIGSAGRIIENPTVEELKDLLASGHPILAVADGKTLQNPYFTNGGPVYHALIIRGYTPTHFITNDPGTRHGEAFQYTYDNLMSSLKDWNNGDVKNGRAVVLVLE